MAGGVGGAAVERSERLEGGEGEVEGAEEEGVVEDREGAGGGEGYVFIGVDEGGGGWGEDGGGFVGHWQDDRCGAPRGLVRWWVTLWTQGVQHSIRRSDRLERNRLTWKREGERGNEGWRVLPQSGVRWERRRVLPSLGSSPLV